VNVPAERPAFEVWPTVFKVKREKRNAPPLDSDKKPRGKKQQRKGGMFLISPSTVLPPRPPRPPRVMPAGRRIGRGIDGDSEGDHDHDDGGPPSPVSPAGIFVPWEDESEIGEGEDPDGSQASGATTPVAGGAETPRASVDGGSGATTPVGGGAETPRAASPTVDGDTAGSEDFLSDDYMSVEADSPKVDGSDNSSGDDSDGGGPSRAPKVKRGEQWPPGTDSIWKLARISRKGKFVGWGGTCACHVNLTEVEKRTTCKKQFTTPKDMSDEEARLCILRWLIAGLEIPEDDPKGRKRHLNKNPRMLRVQSEAELVTIGQAAWSAKKQTFLASSFSLN
jgi:hypothetical protein